MTPGETPRMAGWLESAWLARYLDRQLAGEELAWFEAYLLDKPELLGMIEVDTELRDVLGAGEEICATVGRTSLPSTTYGELDIAKQAKLSERERTVNAGRYGWVATLVFGFAVGWFGDNVTRSRDGPQDLIPNPSRVVFDTMRGVPETPLLEHSKVDSDYLIVEMAVPATAVAVTLQIGNGAVETLTPSRDGFVSFLVSRRSAKAAPYAKIKYQSGKEVIERSIRIEAYLEEAR